MLIDWVSFEWWKYLLLRALHIFARLRNGVVYLVKEVVHAFPVLLLGRHCGHRVQALALLAAATTVAVHHRWILVAGLHHQQLPGNGVGTLWGLLLLLLLVAAGTRSSGNGAGATCVAAAAAPTAAAATAAADVVALHEALVALAQIIGIVVRLPLSIGIRSARWRGQHGVEGGYRIARHLGIVRWVLLHWNEEKLTQEQAVRGEEAVGPSYLLRLKYNARDIFISWWSSSITRNWSADTWLMDEIDRRMDEPA